MKNKKQKNKYAEYCEKYLLTLLSEAESLKECLEQHSLDLVAKQELLEDQISDVENKIEEMMKALDSAEMK
jgi:hypothetical protein